jgi:dTDP-4-dehydrorhamnose reductase
LVTGANGQLGWELSRSLKTLGDVIALDRSACDLSRPRDLAGIVRAVQPHVTVNAAAYTAVDRAEVEEELANLVNGTAVGVIAEETRRLGALLIHYSTDYVFDGTKESPYTEADPANPINAYGRSKLIGERAIAQSGSDYLILRTCWIFASRGHNFLLTILRKAREREELSIVADQIGAPTWARHIAETTALIIRRTCQGEARADFSSEILHVSAGGETTWCGFAEAIVDQAIDRGLLRNRPKIRPITSSEYPLRAARPKNSRLASERLRERFAIALPEWRHGLALCVQDQTLIGAMNLP